MAALKELTQSFAFTATLTLWASMSLAGSEEIDTSVDETVKEGVEKRRGATPQLEKQIDTQYREYERYQQYEPKIEPKVQSVRLSMDNLEVPFEVEVAEGYLGTLTFLDAGGHPYPVRLSRPGDPNAFTVCTGSGDGCQATEEDTPIAHILTIGTTQMAGRTNLTAFFRGLHKAVRISLVARTDSFHDDVTIMLPVSNPDRETSAVARNLDQIPQTNDMVARALIDGLSVEEIGGDAMPLMVKVKDRSGREVPSDRHRAVLVNGKTYLKTIVRLPNPSPEAKTNGAMQSVVYRFDGKERVVTGQTRTGRILELYLSAPEHVLGYKEVGGNGR